MHHSASLELNKVDRLIKALMLSYPMLYKSRFDVLVQMFLFSTHSWLPDGTLDALQDVPTHDSMRYDDLEERQAQELGRQGQDTTGMVTTLNLSRLAALKREFATRRLIESDIDLYASHHVMGEHIQNGMEWLKRFSPAYCSLRDAPFDSMDPEFAAAAEEILVIARDAVWRGLGMHSEFYNPELANPDHLKLYEELCGLLAKLDPITGREARLARNLALTKQLLANIEAEAQL